MAPRPIQMERLFCFWVPETRGRRRYRGVHGVFSCWRVFVSVSPMRLSLSLSQLGLINGEQHSGRQRRQAGFFSFWLDAPLLSHEQAHDVIFCFGSSSNQPASQQQQQHFLWTESIPPTPSPRLFLSVSQSYLIPRFFFLHPPITLAFGFLELSSSWTYADQTREGIPVAEWGWDGTGVISDFGFVSLLGLFLPF